MHACAAAPSTKIRFQRPCPHTSLPFVLLQSCGCQFTEPTDIRCLPSWDWASSSTPLNVWRDDDDDASEWRDPYEVLWLPSPHHLPSPSFVPCLFACADWSVSPLAFSGYPSSNQFSTLPDYSNMYSLTHSLPLPIDHDDGQRREVTVHKKNRITKHALLTPTLSGNIISHSSHWDKAPKGQSGGGRECCTERTDLTTWYRQWIWDCITPIRLPLDPHPLAVLGCHSRSSSVANTPLNLLKEWQGWPHLPLPVWHNNTYGRDRGTADTEDGIASTDMKVG